MAYVRGEGGDPLTSLLLPNFHNTHSFYKRRGPFDNAILIELSGRKANNGGKFFQKMGKVAKKCKKLQS